MAFCERQLRHRVGRTVVGAAAAACAPAVADEPLLGIELAFVDELALAHRRDAGRSARAVRRPWGERRTSSRPASSVARSSCVMAQGCRKSGRACADSGRATGSIPRRGWSRDSAAGPGGLGRLRWLRLPRGCRLAPGTGPVGGGLGTVRRTGIRRAGRTAGLLGTRDGARRGLVARERRGGRSRPFPLLPGDGKRADQHRRPVDGGPGSFDTGRVRARAR